jgi:N-dimethylarginine dimethylaminohydrolase
MSGPTPPLFDEYAELRTVAVCRPAFFELRDPINVIQAGQVERGVSISRELAAAQHADLVRALRAAGADVVTIEPDARFPYQLNARDAGLGTRRGLLLGRFRLPIRRGEQELAAAAAQAAGTPILGAVQHAALEGGDVVVLAPGRAAVGLGPRTEPAALVELRAVLGQTVELIGVPFADRYLHLDMVFNVVAPGLAIACSEALPPSFTSLIDAAGYRLLAVSEAEVFDHACNVLSLGRDRILSHEANPRINALLRAEGLAVVEVDVSELARSGGGPRCLTLPLKRA